MVSAAGACVVNDQVVVPSGAPSVETTPDRVAVKLVLAASCALGVKVTVRPSADSTLVPATGAPVRSRPATTRSRRAG